MKGNYWKRYGKRSHSRCGRPVGRKGGYRAYRANKARVNRHLDKILRDPNEA